MKMNVHAHTHRKVVRLPALLKSHVASSGANNASTVIDSPMQNTLMLYMNDS